MKFVYRRAPGIVFMYCFFPRESQFWAEERILGGKVSVDKPQRDLVSGDPRTDLSHLFAGAERVGGPTHRLNANRTRLNARIGNGPSPSSDPGANRTTPESGSSRQS